MKSEKPFNFRINNNRNRFISLNSDEQLVWAKFIKKEKFEKNSLTIIKTYEELNKWNNSKNSTFYSPITFIEWKFWNIFNQKPMSSQSN